MKRALVIRHLAFEDLGFFAAILEHRRYAVAFAEAGVDDLGAIDPPAADLLVVLGGPIGAYEDAAYPFLGAETALLAARLAADRPTLGICLGAQLMARALGARVYRGAVKEIGWAPVTLSAAGRASPLAALEGVAVLHWHGDTYDLPAAASGLAATPHYANQAFAVGRRGLGLQFHPEVTKAGLERWLIGHACEIAATDGVDVAALRAASAHHAEALEGAGSAFFESWLVGAEAS